MVVGPEHILFRAFSWAAKAKVGDLSARVTVGELENEGDQDHDARNFSLKAESRIGEVPPVHKPGYGKLDVGKATMCEAMWILCRGSKACSRGLCRVPGQRRSNGLHYKSVLWDHLYRLRLENNAWKKMEDNVSATTFITSKPNNYKTSRYDSYYP